VATGVKTPELLIYLVNYLHSTRLERCHPPDACEHEPPPCKLPCIYTENYYSHSKLLFTKPETAAGHAPCGSSCTWQRKIENKGHTHTHTHTHTRTHTRGLNTLHRSCHPTPSRADSAAVSLSPPPPPPSREVHCLCFEYNKPSSSPTGWPLCTVLCPPCFLVQGEHPFENNVVTRCLQP
jgi:hypothetical protein